VATTEGMKGGGYYDDHSEYQRRTAETVDALVEESVRAVPVLAPGAWFVIVDYGASTGRNSIASVRTAVAAVRAREPDRAVAAVHNDVPTNDWNELFANVASRADSYLTVAGPPVLPLASAVSFYEATVPAGAAHLGVSFSAAHWLRTQPTVAVPDAFYFCEATGDARAALAAQADADWTTFLTARAADLAPGGRLVLEMVGTDTSSGEPAVTARALLRAMTEVAAQLVDEGSLDRAAFERYLLPVYARTPEEARAPLERPGPLAAAFTVEVARTDRVPNPYLDRWRADGDGAAYGRSYAAFVRGFTESSLRTNLFGPGGHGDPDALLDDYFGRLERRFAADPEADAFEDWTLTVVLARNL
jgi:cyclopropane-fatty-acyl-phospholipid synthase